MFRAGTSEEPSRETVVGLRNDGNSSVATFTDEANFSSAALKWAAVTAQARHIIDEFEALPDPAKREVLTELIRTSRFIDYPVVAEDELLSAADEIFLEYDRRESSE